LRSMTAAVLNAATVHDAPPCVNCLCPHNAKDPTVDGSTGTLSRPTSALATDLRQAGARAAADGSHGRELSRQEATFVAHNI
jgi:hypothetical protein